MFAQNVESAKQLSVAISAGSVILAFLVALFVRKALAKAVVILLLGALIVVSLSQRANISKCATRIQNEYKDGLGGPATCKFFGRQFKVEVPATVPDDSSGLVDVVDETSTVPVVATSEPG